MRTLIFTGQSSKDVQRASNARRGHISSDSGLGSRTDGRLDYTVAAARMSLGRSGYWIRRLWRNGGILALALVVHLVVMRTVASPDGRQLLYRLSMATGYVSVVLIAWAMLIGPWRVRRGRPAPASTDLRRDVGIWGTVFGLAHVVTGLQVHFAGKFWKYFLYPDGEHV